MRRVGIVLLIAMLAVFAGNVNAQIALNEEHQKQMVMTSLLSMPLVFMENRGQFGDKAFFKAEAGGASFYFCKDEVTYLFVRDTDELVEEDFIPFAEMVSLPDEYLHPRYKKEVLLIKAQFVEANPDAEAIGLDRLSHYNNYFLGNDPAKWHSNVPNYSAIVYNDIYAGIDLKYYGDGRSMKYDFVIEPGADISQIKIRYEGVEGLSVTSDGKLQAQTSFGLVGEEAPHIYQEIAGTKQELSGRYEVIEPNVFGFALDEDYDSSYPLIIDPLLTFSIYLGGESEDWGYDIALDNSIPPCIYVTGRTSSSDFPTENPYQTDQLDWDVFVTKLVPAPGGAILVYSTYLGGGNDDWGYGIAVEDNGNAYVTGRTSSSDFPRSANPYDDNLDGNFDGFVTKFPTDGGNPIYSTYLGGNSYDACHAIALSGDRAYVTGMTYSDDDFETTTNAYQPDNDGYWDAFVTKFNSAGNNLEYSTYLGGSYIETGYGIAVDGSGCAYVTGWTWSEDFDTTSNAYQSNLYGPQDAFITKLSATDNNLEYSTYLGGDLDDYGKDIAVDGLNYAYVTGWTMSNDFPTVNPYQTNQPGIDAFVTKLSATDTTLSYSTYLGGTDEDCGYGIAVDDSACAYVTGRTESTNFPRHGDSTMPDNEMCDVFVTKFNYQGNSPIYSTYLGGNKDDWGYGIALYSLPFGFGYGLFVTGKTWSDDLPNRYLSEYNNNYDAFVSGFVVEEIELPTAVIDSIIHDQTTDKVYFGGHGEHVHNDTTIPMIAYNWRSDIDGHLSDSASDSTDIDSLSPGIHTIYFRVQDSLFAWSLEADTSLEISTDGNYPPVAFIDGITPNPAYPGEWITFCGHGEDFEGDIDVYLWKMGIDTLYLDIDSCFFTTLCPGTHTIYFQVRDDSSVWSDEKSEVLYISRPIEEKWLISWWYPSFGDYFDILMHDSYSFTLFVTNISQTDQPFDFGLNMEYDSLHWLNELWEEDPDWVLEIDAPCLLNGQSYTFGQETTDIIAADETREYVFKISNDWNWVKEWSLTRILEIGISFITGGLPPGFSEIWDLYQNWNTFADFLKSPVLIEYTYTAMDDADPAVLSETYNAWVRPEKIFFYWTSWWLGNIASDFTSLGYNVLSYIPPPPGPPIAAACFVAEAIIFACSEKLYVMAVDPVTSYNNYMHPRRPEDIEGYDVMLGSIEEGCGRYIDHKAFELFSMAEAGCSSYVKCVGALKEGSTEWAAKQFAATYCYSKQQASLMQELSLLTQPFINNIDPPDAAAVDAIINSLEEEGLPDIEVQIMGSLITGFDPDTANALADILIGAYENNTGGICSSFVHLPEILDSLNSILQDIFTCSLLVNPLKGVLIGDVVLIDPEIVISGSGTICTVWVEFPGLAFPLPDCDYYEVEVNDNNENQVTIPGPPLTRDNDDDNVWEIAMVFPPDTTGEGKILQSIFGDVITPSLDTIPFSAAALLTVYSESITSGICGQVREPDNFGPLDSVFVEVYDILDTLVDTTDNDGKFDFPLDPGTYSADFSKPGYHDTTLTDLEVVSNETTCVCLVMHAIPDVAVTNVVPSDTIVFQGNLTYIDVTLENQGVSSETFDVTAYYGTMFYDNFESGQKIQWTYYAENLEGSAITEINDDIYAQTPTHSLYISNLYGDDQGQNNGIAYAVLAINELPLTIPYTIEFWFYPSQSDYWPDYNGWKILEADNDITILLHDDPDGIFVIDEDGEHQISYPDFQFQAWHKIKYTRTGANSYILKIDDIERTGDPIGDLLSNVSTILIFGDTDPFFSKGEGYWDDLIIGSPIETKTVTDLPSGEDTNITFTWNTAGVEPGIYTISARAHPVSGETDTEDNTYVDGTVTIAPVPIPTLSEWGMIVLALLLLAVGTVAVIRRRRAVAVGE